MKVTFRFTFYLLIAVFFITISGCSKGTTESAASDVNFEDADKIVADMDRLINDLPSPTEVPYLLKATGEDFNASLINDLSRIPQYETNEDETALNLGVYATDMGYLVSYEKIDEASRYMESCQKLAEALGISSVFDVATMEKFQNNLDNPDSINALFAKAIVDIEGRLESSDRASIAALVLSGSFVEGLYLAVMIIENYPSDILDEENRNLILEPLVRVVLEQRKPLLDVIAMLKDLPQDDIIAKMITEMNILKLLYDGDLADIEKKIASNTGDFILTQDMLVDVTTEVKRIRKDIVEFQ